MNHLVLLIKPASSLCNMRCKYCFYHDIASVRDIASYGLMTEQTAENIINKAFIFSKKSVTFCFQGGEPTLTGIDFYKYFINKINELNINKIKISYALQTNGLNINDDFASFFKQNHFLIGVSMDGSKDTNDYFRLDTLGSGTFNSIKKATELLNKYEVDYNILCVITSPIARHAEKTYNFYKKNNYNYLQFIPYIAPLDEEPFSHSYSLTPELYLNFLKNLFMCWYNDYVNGKYISIRMFDNMIQILLGNPPEECGMNGYCQGQFVIEGDGRTFPCDFYCVDNWLTGNINTQSFEEISNSINMKKFIESSYYNKEECSTCSVYMLCRGGCRRYRDHNKDGSAGKNIYCETFHYFYEFALPYLKNIINMRQ